MRTILDTSVIVSGLISPHGSPVRIINHWLAEAFILLYSSAIREEWADVLHRTWLTERLVHLPHKVPALLTAIDMLAEPIKGYVNVFGAVRDPFDEMFLACAVLGQADYLVSVDNDLLSLGKFQETTIVTPAQFLAVLQNSNS